MSLKAAKLTIVQKILLVEEESILNRINEILENELIVGYPILRKRPLVPHSALLTFVKH
jgi:hypothetical protein